MAVEHLNRLNEGPQQADARSRFSRRDHALDTERHILGREVMPVPPLDLLMELEGIGQAVVRHLPAFGQVTDDFVGLERVKLNDLVIEWANRAQGPQCTCDMGVPHLGVGVVEHHPMSAIFALLCNGRRWRDGSGHGRRTQGQPGVKNIPPG